MLTVARAALSRLVDVVAFLVVIVVGVSAGYALAAAEDVELAIKKRIVAHRPLNPR